MEQIYSMLGISAEVEAFGNAVLKDLKERFEKIDAVAEYNQCKVLHAMQKNHVSEACLLQARRAMATMTMGAISWKRYMRAASGQRRLWCAPRLPAAHMHWQSR